MQEQANKRPRICQVLGVEVGEVFTADTPCGRFQRCVIDEEGQILNTGTNVLCYMLNHPDRIIRKPRFTEEEVADARSITRLIDGSTAAEIERMETGTLRLLIPLSVIGKKIIDLDCTIFPSIRLGQAVRLEDIT